MYLRFPDFLNPNALSFRIFDINLSLTWYSLSYIFGIICAWYLIYSLTKKQSLWHEKSPLNTKDVEDLMTYLILGIILGGRMGYVLFYNPSFYISSPISIFYLWEGGMSFHGGFIGVVLGALYYCIRNKISILPMGDIIAVSTPPGLFLGRLANFVNQELWGKPTTFFLGMEFTKFPANICPKNWESEICIRHPSQLYESFGEGPLLFLILFYISKLTLRPGIVSASFLIGYGLIRSIIEVFRQPDAHIGFLAGESLTLGQLLSLPMIICGLSLIHI